MSDVATALYQLIMQDFESRMQRDERIKQIQNKIDNEKADFTDIYKYADRIGELGSEVLIECFDESNLPNGILYWNIAQRTVKPLLKYIHKLINEKAATVQKSIDTTNGIGLNSIAGTFPEDRIDDLIQKIVDMSIKESEAHGKPADE